jgi:small ligand-binding sensory domain FIST
MSTMKWFSALSENTDALKALDECVGKTREAASDPPDVSFLFPAAQHSEHFERLPEELHKRLGPKHILGCSGGGIIGGGIEAEHRPALCLLSGWLPGVDIHPFYLEQKDIPSPDAAPKAWRDWTGAPQDASFLLLVDPFSLNAEELLQGLDYAYPKSVKIGGLASGAAKPRGNALFLDHRTIREGGVGIAFSGDMAIDPIVAQGCRPIGKPLRITQCDRNLLMEIDGQRPLDVLEELLESLSEADQKLARNALFVGLLGDPFKTGTSKRDYLVRNLMGLDAQKGILAVGAPLRIGQTIQFHLRDEHTSAADLNERLTQYAQRKETVTPEGALLFSCLGRGKHLYNRENHDSDLFTQRVGPLAMGGFFCNGEIGPVDGSTYLHGFTSCFGIFRPLEKTQ